MPSHLEDMPPPPLNSQRVSLLVTESCGSHTVPANQAIAARLNFALRPVPPLAEIKRWPQSQC